MPCVIIIVMMMMMMMIFDTLQITVVALDGCYKFFKNRRTYKKRSQVPFLKCNSTVYLIITVLTCIRWNMFLWTKRYIRDEGKRPYWLQWICILPGVLEYSKTLSCKTLEYLSLCREEKETSISFDIIRKFSNS